MRSPEASDVEDGVCSNTAAAPLLGSHDDSVNGEQQQQQEEEQTQQQEQEGIGFQKGVEKQYHHAVHDAAQRLQRARLLGGLVATAVTLVMGTPIVGIAMATAALALFLMGITGKVVLKMQLPVILCGMITFGVFVLLVHESLEKEPGDTIIIFISSLVCVGTCVVYGASPMVHYAVYCLLRL